MLSFLYGLGRAAYRRRLATLLGWLTLLVVAGVAFTIQKGFDENFSLPATESQEASTRSTEPSPKSAGPRRESWWSPPRAGARSAAVRDAIEVSVQRSSKSIRSTGSPSPIRQLYQRCYLRRRSGSVTSVGLNVDQPDIVASTYVALDAETKRLQSAIPGSQVSAGGGGIRERTTRRHPHRRDRSLMALLVLLLTLGSLRAAGMPLLTAILGVALTMLLIVGATGITTVSSTTPLLALMLGLAVGIDYALFITSRHRDQLRDGMDPEESVARAAGHRRLGRGIRRTDGDDRPVRAGRGRHPVPHHDGRRGGDRRGYRGAHRADPAARAAGLRRRAAAAPPAYAGRQGSGPLTLSRTPPRWIGAWLAAVGHQGPGRSPCWSSVGLAMAYPAKDLRIALPSNGAAPGSPARTTYDLISEHFGPGYNGPLIVTAIIVGSDDPLGVMDGIADEIRKLPGVASVPLPPRTRTRTPASSR